MMVEATIVTTGAPDATSASVTPPMSGTLLVARTASADDMPAAGTSLPLYGIIGAITLLFGIGLLAFTRKPALQA
jgi:hypothetical protein